MDTTCSDLQWTVAAKHRGVLRGARMALCEGDVGSRGCVRTARVVEYRRTRNAPERQTWTCQTDALETHQRGREYRRGPARKANDTSRG